MFCSNQDAFFSLYFRLENNWSKATQKRSVLVSELKIELPEKLLFSFQYKVLSAEGGECAVHSSTHLQPNLLHKTSPRWMPFIEDKVRPLENKISWSKADWSLDSMHFPEVWIAIWTCLFLFSGYPGILGQPYANSDTLVKKLERRNPGLWCPWRMSPQGWMTTWLHFGPIIKVSVTLQKQKKKSADFCSTPFPWGRLPQEGYGNLGYSFSWTPPRTLLPNLEGSRM